MGSDAIKTNRLEVLVAEELMNMKAGDKLVFVKVEDYAHLYVIGENKRKHIGMIEEEKKKKGDRGGG